MDKFNNAVNSILESIVDSRKPGVYDPAIPGSVNKCQRCGSEEFKINKNYSDEYQVRCKCNGCFKVSSEMPSEKEAIADWNKDNPKRNISKSTSAYTSNLKSPFDGSFVLPPL